MGIADTLYDAVEAIQDYMREGRGPPAPLQPKLDKLVADMDAMRAELDALPPKGPSEGSS